VSFFPFYSFNGFALWLPDLYNRLAAYSEAHPNHTVTICDVVSALSDSSAAPDTFIFSSDVEIQLPTEINNLSYTDIQLHTEINNLSYTDIQLLTEINNLSHTDIQLLTDINNLTYTDKQLLTDINNLTYTELMTANNTITVPISPIRSSAEDGAMYDVAVDIQNTTALVDMVAATNGTWLYDDTSTPTCNATANEAAFRNSLAIGVVSAIVYTSSGYLVDCIDRKKLMSKL
jgi:hypothetical protein